ncbi:MAG: hypothetical protein M1600_11140 [Firmicutes bacterium]|nr:hypothetical protein [Bacillota bacterium]
MKSPQDLCRVEYRVYRRQMQQIHRLARATHQRPSEYLRSLLDGALEIHAPSTEEGP